MEVETTTGVMLSLHRYNEAVRLLERYVRLADSIDVGAETKRETWDWLENVYGKPWQNCEIPGCYSNRRCLVHRATTQKYIRAKRRRPAEELSMAECKHEHTLPPTRWSPWAFCLDCHKDLVPKPEQWGYRDPQQSDAVGES